MKLTWLHKKKTAWKSRQGTRVGGRSKFKLTGAGTRLFVEAFAREVDY